MARATGEKGGRGIFRGRRGATRPYENVDGCGICCGDCSGDVADASAARSYATRARDALQEKCIRLAFCRAFPHNNRVRVHTTFLTLAGVDFILVERTITGCDDAVYRANRDVWEHVPRGQASVLIADPGEGAPRLVATLQGLRKFGQFDAPYGVECGTPVVAVALEAIDGDCGHVTAFAHDGERFWLVGTKDVHMLVRFDVPEEDLALYGVDEGVSWRAAVPKRVVGVWRDTLRALPEGRAAALHDYLGTTGRTACFDGILRECGHLVDHGPRETLKFYAVTCRGATPHEGLCADPASSMAALQSFGLDVVTPQPAVELGTDEYAVLRDGVARRLNCEGAVLYGCNEAGVVVRMWKQRSHAYAMERAAQEAIVTHRLCGVALRSRLAGKLARLPEEVRRCLGDWEAERLDYLVRFAAWLHVTGRQTARTELGGLQDLRRRWITLQNQFAQCVAVDAHVRSQVMHYEPSGDDAVTSDPDAVVCVGPQGCGKSTFSRTLYALLRQAGLSPCWINQDEAGGGRQFLDAIRHAQRGGHTHLIIDKMNLDEAARDDYADLGLRALTVVWSHPDGTDALVDICFDRVRRRGSAHRTFKADRREGRRVRQTLLGCATRCRPPTEGPLIEVSVTDDTATIARRVWAELSARGLTDIPEIETLDMAAALGVANAYESFLCRFPRHVEYAAIQIASPERVLELVPPEMLDGKKVQKAFHVTTLYLGRDACKDPVLLRQLVGLLGESIELTLTSVASDPKGTAIAVRNEGEFPCENVHPHITIANAPGVPPVYSNELLDDSHADDPCRTVVSLPAGTRVTGTFVFR
ncbi:hypothetical protein C3747_152g90 [Trypanosoma cruzi]|uniref:tRNA ligase phosphodiesterase domain-containing protein n=1 Tax=Trypanosoma cruzi TaxID=5693 RepID=A0A2V2W7W7_TRYCR|nr:hypothetical protein C3747_152g90 [Trypanosoma cruzi]